MLPNTRYFQIHLTIEAENNFLVTYSANQKTFHGSYLNVDPIDEVFYVTEKQYETRNVFDKIIEGHIKAALRKDIERYELGTQKIQYNEYGDEVAWDLIEGHLENEDLMMWTLPRYKAEILKEVVTDAEGNIIE